MTHSLATIVDGLWDDCPLFIVAGGPSLASYQDEVKRLDRYGRTLGCNRSAFWGETQVIFSIDQHWLRMDRKRIIEFIAAGAEAYFAVPPNYDESLKLDGAVYFERRRGNALSEVPCEIFGTNTGFGALNLAFHKGASELHLLGFDMSVTSERTHNHNGYSWSSQRSTGRYLHKWAETFVRAAAQLQARGTRVTNWVGEPCSKIPETVFMQRPLTELFQ